MGLRVAALLFVGLPACAAICVGFPLLGVFSLTGGPPLERVDWVGGVVFTVVALGGFALALRAAIRVWRGGASVLPFVTRFSPLLLLAGLIGGVWAAFFLQRGHEQRSEALVTSAWCERPALVGHQTREACEQAALDCLHLAWEGATLEPGIAERLLATVVTRRREAEREATRRSKSDGYYDGSEVRVLDRLLEQLRTDGRRPNDTRVRQAGLACLVTRGS